MKSRTIQLSAIICIGLASCTRQTSPVNSTDKMAAKTSEIEIALQSHIDAETNLQSAETKAIIGTMLLAQLGSASPLKNIESLTTSLAIDGLINQELNRGLSGRFKISLNSVNLLSIIFTCN